jgi:hypothetical protein
LYGGSIVHFGAWYNDEDDRSSPGIIISWFVAEADIPFEICDVGSEMGQRERRKMKGGIVGNCFPV